MMHGRQEHSPHCGEDRRKDGREGKGEACFKKIFFCFFRIVCNVSMFGRELTNGIPVFDENGNRLGLSKRAAASAIVQVVVSRVLMATPGMC